MKPVGFIITGVLVLLLGAVAPTIAQQDQKDQEATKQEQQTKPDKQQQAKPAKQEKQQQAKPERQQQTKPARQEQQAKPEKQQQQKQAKSQQEQTKSHNQQQMKPVKVTKQDQQQQARGQQSQQAQGQWAHNGQKDSRGHEYNENRFGREHHARFEENGGRYYIGRREYSYGGYWFYADAYPAWFYQQDVYFIMGADGLWYAVAYADPSLTFQVDIE